MLLNIPTGNIISNALNSPTGSVDIMPGFFDIFLLTGRALKGGGTAADAYFNTFHTEFGGKEKTFRFGEGLMDDFIYDTESQRILHRWTDIHGNGYSVMVQDNGRTDLCIPTLFLVDVRGSSYRLQGTESRDSGDYIPPIHWQKYLTVFTGSGFISDSERLAFPVNLPPHWLPFLMELPMFLTILLLLPTRTTHPVSGQGICLF